MWSSIFSPFLDEFESPVLVGGALVPVGEDGGPVIALGTLDVQALASLTDYPVPGDCPLLVVVVQEGHDPRLSTTFRFKDHVVEAGMYDAMSVEVPELVPCYRTLFRPDDDPSTGGRISSADVEHFVVHLADDEEITSGIRFCKSRYIEKVKLLVGCTVLVVGDDFRTCASVCSCHIKDAMGDVTIADGGSIAFPQLIGISRIVRIYDERVTCEIQAVSGCL